MKVRTHNRGRSEISLTQPLGVNAYLDKMQIPKDFAPKELGSEISLAQLYGCEYVISQFSRRFSFLFQPHMSLYVIFGLGIDLT